MHGSRDLTRSNPPLICPTNVFGSLFRREGSRFRREAPAARGRRIWRARINRAKVERARHAGTRLKSLRSLATRRRLRRHRGSHGYGASRSNGLIWIDRTQLGFKGVGAWRNRKGRAGSSEHDLNQKIEALSSGRFHRAAFKGRFQGPLSWVRLKMTALERGFRSDGLDPIAGDFAAGNAAPATTGLWRVRIDPRPIEAKPLLARRRARADKGRSDRVQVRMNFELARAVSGKVVG
jgi:hypothetical protein